MRCPLDYKKAIYAGTFDPFTKGHYAIVDKAINIFENLTILVAKSPIKTPLIPVKDRVKMLEKIFSKKTQIVIKEWDGLLIDFAKKNKIGTIIRGLRPTGDFENEYQMSMMNNKLLPKIHTVFFMTEPDVNYISSSLVREIFGHGGNVDNFLPEEVLNYLKKIKRSK
jgi:pantetheine-phosphate adenylyltransferase